MIRFLSVLLLLTAALAQSPAGDPAPPANGKAAPARSAPAPLTDAQTQPPKATDPVITFTFHFPGGDPELFSLAVDSAGTARYTSRGPKELAPGRVPHDELYVLDFTMTEATRQRIFDAAAQLNRFRDNLEFGGKIANMGAKTFIWSGPDGRFNTTFNYTENPAGKQLAELFFDISTVIEARRRLEYKVRFDRLGVEDELRKLESRQKAGRTAEMEAIAPLLRRIANDANLMRIARQRAARLLVGPVPQTVPATPPNPPQ